MSSDSLVISDTSSIILLDKINELDILRDSFAQVFTTPVVAREFGIRLPEWLTVREVINQANETRLNAIMDPGEAIVLALAAEINDCYVLIDDNKARRYAEQNRQKYLGTLGLILRAKRLDVIPSVKPLLAKVQQTDFRATADLYELVIREAGE